ncbi:MAG: efflux RND transporter periplasmic adaptor subunit [Gemmatimonadetes bacterium]|nr:efflux RND transporter periplasmic adaptor subunit [Gemmatimonadota bacterium]
MPVTVAPVTERAVPYEISAVGTVTPLQTVAVRSQVSGILVHVGFREGDDVQAGQLLFRLDQRPFQAALDQALATLARDRAQLANAQRQVARYEELAQSDLASREQIDQLRTNAEAAAASLAADSASALTARLNLDYAQIRARIRGRSGSLYLREGNLVRTTDPNPLVVINQIRPIGVSFAVPQRFLDDIRRYSANRRLEVGVRAQDSSAVSAQGVLSFVDNRVDTTTGTIQLRATFPNDDSRLWPGQFVTVRLVLTVEPRALTVPSQAVMTSQRGTYVFVLQPDRTVRIQDVALGRTMDNYVVIARGLAAGDLVVTDGQLRLTAGAAVDVKTGNGGRGAGAAGATP